MFTILSIVIKYIIGFSTGANRTPGLSVAAKETSHPLAMAVSNRIEESVAPVDDGATQLMGGEKDSFHHFCL